MRDGGSRAQIASAVEGYLDSLAPALEQDRESRTLLLEELRSHLLDSAERHLAAGLPPSECVRRAVEALGPMAPVTSEIGLIHTSRDMREAVTLAALPVLCTLVLRWVAFEPGGSSDGWVRALPTGWFLVLAVAVLLLPLRQFSRSQLAIGAWSAMWLLSVILVAFE
jgi:hypothetical protein